MISQELAQELIAKSIKGDPFFTIDDIAEMLESNQAQLWRFDNSVMVTEIVNYEKTKTKAIQIITAGGDLRELINKMRPTLEAWAKEQGCTHVVVEGRKGWVGALKNQGYSEISTTVVKELK